MKRSRKRLALLWFIGSGCLFVFLIVQSLAGTYGSSVNEVWAWFLPTVLPTVSLITAVLAADALGQTFESKKVDQFFYRLAIILSVAYLLAVGSTVFVSPLVAVTPLTLMKTSNLYLGPFQGVLTGTLGVFFLKK